MQRNCGASGCPPALRLDVAWESADKPRMHDVRTRPVNIQCGIITTS
jgi:hypothetical protein